MIKVASKSVVTTANSARHFGAFLAYVLLLTVRRDIELVLIETVKT